jgi:hypothetical protein
MAFTNFNQTKPVQKGAANMTSGPVEMTLDRNFTVRSTLGHMITFKKGVPLTIPAVMVRTCAEVGAKRVDGADAVAAEIEEAKPTQPIDPGHRLEDVRAAIEQIVERNDIDEFTAGGTPKVPAVTSEAGYKIDRTEVIRAWKQRNEELAEAQ